MNSQAPSIGFHKSHRLHKWNSLMGIKKVARTHNTTQTAIFAWIFYLCSGRETASSVSEERLSMRPSSWHRAAGFSAVHAGVEPLLHLQLRAAVWSFSLWMSSAICCCSWLTMGLMSVSILAEIWLVSGSTWALMVLQRGKTWPQWDNSDFIRWERGRSVGSLVQQRTFSIPSLFACVIVD